MKMNIKNAIIIFILMILWMILETSLMNTSQNATTRLNIAIISSIQLIIGAILGFLAKYILDRVTVFEYDTTQSVSITYKKGEETLSVYDVTRSAYTPNGKFETVKINGVEARYKDSDFGRTLSWSWKGSDISVYGKISKEELIRVVESII